jgi:hypothetical protein
MMNTTGGGTPGCGHSQKPGTRFCTVCGQPAAADADSPYGDSTYGDSAYEATQTVAVPPPQRHQDPQPHQDPQWQQGAAWGQPAWRQDPGRQHAPPGGWPAGPQGPEVPPDGPHRSPWLLAAGIAASLLLVGGAGGGAYLLAAHGKSPTPIASVTSAPAANTAPVTPAASTTPAPAPATTAATTTPPPTTPPPTTAPPPVTEQQAATHLSGLLAQSVSIRNSIVNASQDAGRCGGAYTQDAQTFRQAATARRNLIGQLDSLPGAQTLPVQMLSDLRSAWQASATADDDYARWADDEAAQGCTTNDTWLAATNTPNQQATADKMAFIVLWNPIASRYGLPTYTQDQL